jgi:hypothetical protein
MWEVKFKNICTQNLTRKIRKRLNQANFKHYRF